MHKPRHLKNKIRKKIMAKHPFRGEDYCQAIFIWMPPHQINYAHHFLYSYSCLLLHLPYTYFTNLSLPNLIHIPTSTILLFFFLNNSYFLLFGINPLVFFNLRFISLQFA